MNGQGVFEMVSAKPRGFTLIELIIVIVLLGILAATALPKFANLTIQAKNAANQGMAGAMGSATSIAHAAWLANGAPTEVGGSNISLEGSTVHVNTLGWPDGSVDTTATPSACANVWTSILTNPPPAGCASGCSNVCTTSSTNNCYIASAAGSVCTYTQSSSSSITVTYDMNGGAIGSTSQ